MLRLKIRIKIHRNVNFILLFSFQNVFFLLLLLLIIEVNFNEAAYKNKQMMSKCSKERATGSMAGYFETEFKILAGAYVDPISLRRQARLEEKKKNIVTKPFVSMYRARDP